jgi:hypothetical protein
VKRGETWENAQTPKQAQSTQTAGIDAPKHRTQGQFNFGFVEPAWNGWN